MNNPYAEIYEFSDYVQVTNCEGVAIWLCPSKKMSKTLGNTGLVKIYEFYEAVDGSCQNQIEAIVHQTEWDRIKQGRNSKFLFRKEVTPCDAQTQKKAPHLERKRGDKINRNMELVSSNSGDK